MVTGYVPPKSLGFTGDLGVSSHLQNCECDAQQHYC